MPPNQKSAEPQFSLFELACSLFIFIGTDSELEPWALSMIHRPIFLPPFFCLDPSFLPSRFPNRICFRFSTSAVFKPRTCAALVTKMLYDSDDTELLARSLRAARQSPRKRYVRGEFQKLVSKAVAAHRRQAKAA